MTLQVAISAGELSGDMHAAGVVAALQNTLKYEFFGMGGSNLRAVGVDTIIDSESATGGVMGFFGVLGKLPAIFKSLAIFERALKIRRPAALILVDYPGFNLRLAKIAHGLGIPVFYFIIPKMWVWKAARLELLKSYVQRTFTIFPFEHDWLAVRGYNSDTFVGHPIASQISARPINRDEIRAQLEVPPGAKLLAVLPGSRTAELRYHLSIIAQTVTALRTQFPGLVAVAPVASTQTGNPMWRIAKDAGIKLSALNSIDIMRAADAGIIKSGTSTLEAAACGLPSVMIYKASALTAIIVRKFIRANDYSLPNIIKTGTMRELTQEQASVEKISTCITEMLATAGGLRERARYEQMMQVLSVDDNPGQVRNQQTPYERVASGLVQALGFQT